ncbi:MAG TPA: CHC2 zinc finger domain-containing protein, partial [Armatimonadota bacterium]
MEFFRVAGSREAIEEIRNRLGVVDVISEYVTLQRAGKGYKGLCPFHA